MCKYSWVKDFEDYLIKELNLNLKEKGAEIKIILGLAPYKQGFYIGGSMKPFKVPSSVPPYNQLGNIAAFLVFDWRHITSSLEMIFNLLFKDSTNSLCVLSYLRKNSVPAVQFAEYLFTRHNIILTNISGNSNKLTTFINAQTSPVLIIATGNKAFKYTHPINSQKILLIHPSTNNITSERYYENWYDLKSTNSNQAIAQAENIIIDKFKLV